MQFTRKNTIVEAEQWFPEHNGAGLELIVLNGDVFGMLHSVIHSAEFGDPHLSGQRLVRPGDYLMIHEDGLKEIWRREDFEKQYTPHFDFALQVNLTEITVIKTTIELENIEPRFPGYAERSPRLLPLSLPDRSHSLR